MSTWTTHSLDVWESIQDVGPVLTQWRMGMRRGYALLIYVNDPIADMCEVGDDFDHEWDSPVTLHYAGRDRWDRWL